MRKQLAGILFLGLVGICTVAGTEEPPVKAESRWTTSDYQEMNRQEQESEAEELLASIEEYRDRQQAAAEEQFRQVQEYYQIPDEYADAGGSLPDYVQDHIFALCDEKEIDPAIVIALIEVESGYQYDAMGDAGDSGYMQVVARYAKKQMEELGVTNLFDPIENISVGIEVLAQLLEKYDGNYAKALTAYNAGAQGAYEDYFSAGVEASPYAEKVLEAAERIGYEG